MGANCSSIASAATIAIGNTVSTRGKAQTFVLVPLTSFFFPSPFCKAFLDLYHIYASDFVRENFRVGTMPKLPIVEYYAAIVLASDSIIVRRLAAGGDAAKSKSSPPIPVCFLHSSDLHQVSVAGYFGLQTFKGDGSSEIPKTVLDIYISKQALGQPTASSVFRLACWLYSRSKSIPADFQLPPPTGPHSVVVVPLPGSKLPTERQPQQQYQAPPPSSQYATAYPPTYPPPSGYAPYPNYPPVSQPGYPPPPPGYSTYQPTTYPSPPPQSGYYGQPYPSHHYHHHHHQQVPVHHQHYHHHQHLVHHPGQPNTPAYQAMVATVGPDVKKDPGYLNYVSSFSVGFDPKAKSERGRRMLHDWALLVECLLQNSTASLEADAHHPGTFTCSGEGSSHQLENIMLAVADDVSPGGNLLSRLPQDIAELFPMWRSGEHRCINVHPFRLVNTNARKDVATHALGPLWQALTFAKPAPKGAEDDEDPDETFDRHSDFEIEPITRDDSGLTAAAVANFCLAPGSKLTEPEVFEGDHHTNSSSTSLPQFKTHHEDVGEH